MKPRSPFVSPPVALHLSCRGLALVDAENLVGGTRPTRDEVMWAHDSLYAAAYLPEGSQTILACSHNAAANICTCWQTSHRNVWRSGPDGAELAIIDEVRSITNLSQFGYVVIGSGDHSLAPMARSLRNDGVFVHVISREGSLARELKKQASFVTLLAPPSFCPPASDFELAA